MKTSSNKPNNRKTQTVVVVCSVAAGLIILICALIFFFKHGTGKPELFDNPSDTGQYVAFDESDLDLINDEYMYRVLDTSEMDEYSIAAVVIKSDSSEYDDISFVIQQQTAFEDDMRGADYFLKHNPDGSEGYPGQIFTESETSMDFLGFNWFNSVIYGHNMKDKSAFGWIRTFTEEDVFNNYNYAYIYYSTGAVARYKLACISTVSDANLTTQFNGFDSLSDQSDFLDYIYDCATNIKIKKTDNMINNSRYVTLSTCLGDDTKRRALLLEYDGALFVDSVKS